MTTKQKQDVCIRELLFGTEFLSEYKIELNELFDSPAVMQIVNDIAASTPDEIEFSFDSDTPEFQNFKKGTINQTFFDENLKFRFPAYRDIVASVAQRGKTALSATISIYYALRYLTLSATTPDTSKKTIPTSPPLDAHEMISDYDFRKKWQAAYRCEDGHYVRSKNEQLVDNWLYHHNICHAYELLVVDKRNGKEYINDFYLPQYKLFIEVWGLETPEYLRRKEQKIEVYRANNLKLLQMTDKEIKSLDDFLRRSLSAYRNTL